MLSCFDIANYFICIANETGSFINNSKLQKLVYYAQAWHMAFYKQPLFAEDFEAWIHGPVIPKLFEKYKFFEWRPILENTIYQLPQNVVEFLDEISDEYFAYDAYELEQMVKQEAPWLQTRKKLSPDTPSHAIISKEWLAEYYGTHCIKQ